MMMERTSCFQSLQKVEYPTAWTSSLSAAAELYTFQIALFKVLDIVTVVVTIVSVISSIVFSEFKWFFNQVSCVYSSVIVVICCYYYCVFTLLLCYIVVYLLHH